MECCSDQAYHEVLNPYLRYADVIAITRWGARGLSIRRRISSIAVCRAARTRYRVMWNGNANKSAPMPPNCYGYNTASCTGPAVVPKDVRSADATGSTDA